MALIERLAADSGTLALHEQVDQVLKDSGLIEHFRRDKADRGEARVENLDELVSAARGFAPEARSCRRWRPSSPTRRSSPARARRMSGRTACR